MFIVRTLHVFKFNYFIEMETELKQFKSLREFTLFAYNMCVCVRLKHLCTVHIIILC